MLNDAERGVGSNSSLVVITYLALLVEELPPNLGVFRRMVNAKS